MPEGVEGGGGAGRADDGEVPVAVGGEPQDEAAESALRRVEHRRGEPASGGKGGGSWTHQGRVLKAREEGRLELPTRADLEGRRMSAGIPLLSPPPLPATPQRPELLRLSPSTATESPIHLPRLSPSGRKICCL